MKGAIDKVQNSQNLSVIMPSIPSDIEKLLNNTKFYFEFLPIKNIYVIGPETISEKIKSLNDDKIIFVNESDFVDVTRLREIYSMRTNDKPGHAGWYIQQFIKMSFARFTHDEYYLIWDSDTIPLKPVKMFDDDTKKPFFDMKLEFNRAYFEAIKKILPGIYNPINQSFISEHMIIKVEFMRELISEIENNDNFTGKNFQEKIINAIEPESLRGSGFSEFETYGYYVTSRHPGAYTKRRWCSLRTMKGFYDNSSEIDEVQREWLRKKYHAVSIEKWQKVSSFRKSLVKSGLFRKIFGPGILEYIDRPDRLIIPASIRPFLKRILHK